MEWEDPISNDTMKINSTTQDLDLSNSEDLTPMSHLSIRPESLNYFELTENKENSKTFANKEVVEREPLTSENSMPKTSNENKKDEKTVSNQQTKEILKMILEMNDVLFL